MCDSTPALLKTFQPHIISLSPGVSVQDSAFVGWRTLGFLPTILDSLLITIFFITTLQWVMGWPFVKYKIERRRSVQIMWFLFLLFITTFLVLEVWQTFDVYAIGQCRLTQTNTSCRANCTLPDIESRLETVVKMRPLFVALSIIIPLLPIIQLARFHLSVYIALILLACTIAINVIFDQMFQFCGRLSECSDCTGIPSICSAPLVDIIFWLATANLVSVQLMRTTAHTNKGTSHATRQASSKAIASIDLPSNSQFNSRRDHNEIPSAPSWFRD